MRAGVSRILEHLAVLADAILFVAVPEVDLDALDAPLLETRELGAAHVARMHPITRRLRSVVVRTA